MSSRILRLVALIAILAPTTAATMSAAVSFLYFGTSSATRGTGIALARFDSDTGTMSPPSLAIEARDPAIFVFSADGSRLYLCNSGTPGGVSACAINPQNGALTFLNFVKSEGRGPSSINLDHTGHYVLDANYGGGFVEVLALADDGSLGAQTALVKHVGHGIHPQRQTKPYAHCFRVDPTNRFAIAADLGLDQLVVYRFDAKTGALTANDPPFKSVAPGSGPRHFAWHPNGTFLYAVNELANTVTVFDWDATHGVLHERQTITTLPADFTGNSTSAEIAVHPGGRFLYTSNRGHDSIAVFAIDETNGHLTSTGIIHSRGKTPRYFAIDPSGRWLIVDNMDSDAAVVFRLDETTGRLTPHGEPIAIGRPSGLGFLRIKH